MTQTNYWPHGAPSYLAYGNSVARGATFNSRLQPGQLWDTLNNDASKYLFAESPMNWGDATHPDNGNLYGLTLYAGGPAPLANLQQFAESFGYDTVNRLNSATDGGGWSRSFGYDAYGNSWVITAAGGPWSGSTPVASTVFTGANQISGTSYDASGDQLQVNGNTVSYDAENRMTTVTESGASETLAYDGAGQRVEKMLPTVTTVYVYDAFGQLAAEYSSAGGNTLACSTCYLSVDHLGSTRMVTDQNGNVVARHDYLPFGEELAGGTVGRSGQWGPGNDNINQKFTGQIRDSETGLDFFNARYFGAALGRFTSPDPANAGADLTNPQSWNGYAYVWNNPLVNTDPSGADTCSDGSYADACVTATPDPVDLESVCWWCWEYGIPYTGSQQSAQPAQQPAPTPQQPPLGSSQQLPKNGARNCSANPASAGQYAAATA